MAKGGQRRTRRPTRRARGARSEERRERDLFCEGPVLARTFVIHASPPLVPCATCDGICDYIIGVAHLARVRAQERTECSDQGAQSMSLTGQSNMT